MRDEHGGIAMLLYGVNERYMVRMKRDEHGGIAKLLYGVTESYMVRIKAKG